VRLEPPRIWYQKNRQTKDQKIIALLCTLTLIPFNVVEPEVFEWFLVRHGIVPNVNSVSNALKDVFDTCKLEVKQGAPQGSPTNNLAFDSATDNFRHKPLSIDFFAVWRWRVDI
jgi:hypothetical protein